MPPAARGTGDIESSSENSCECHTLQRKWIVLASAVMSQAVGVAFVFSLGVLYVELMGSFEVSRTQAAWVASLAVGMSQMLGVVGGVSVNMLGCRVTSIIAGILSCLGLVASFFATSVFYLYVSFGIFVGIAVSLELNSSTASVSQYFTTGRTMALSLVMVGQGVGTMFYPPLFELFLVTYNWRGALLVMAGLMLNMCVFGSLRKPVPIAALTSEKQQSRRLSTRNLMQAFVALEVLKSKPYLIYLPARLMLGFGTSLIYTIMVDLAISKGFSRQTGVWLLVYYNAGNIVGRVLSSLLQIKRTVSAMDLHIVFALLLAVTYFIYPWMKTFEAFLIVSILSGLSLGVVICTFAAIPAQLVDPKFFPTAFGLQTTFHGVAVLLAPPLTAWITDITESYDWSMIMIGCLMLVGLIFCAASRVLLYRMERKARDLRDRQTDMRHGEINQVYTPDREQQYVQ